MLKNTQDSKRSNLLYLLNTIRGYNESSQKSVTPLIIINFINKIKELLCNKLNTFDEQEFVRVLMNNLVQILSSSSFNTSCCALFFSGCCNSRINCTNCFEMFRSISDETAYFFLKYYIFIVDLDIDTSNEINSCNQTLYGLIYSDSINNNEKNLNNHITEFKNKFRPSIRKRDSSRIYRTKNKRSILLYSHIK